MDRSKRNPAVSFSLFKIQAKFKAFRKLCLKMNTVGKEMFAPDTKSLFLPSPWKNKMTEFGHNAWVLLLKAVF